MRNFLIFILTLLPLVIVSCGGNDDEPNSGNENTSKVTTDYTASTSVKTVKLTGASGIYFDEENIINFYEDYNHSYAMYLLDGSICFTHFYRDNGKWSCVSHWNSYNEFSRATCGIKDAGLVGNISEIRSKDIEDYYGEVISYHLAHFSANFQPNHGYAIMFTTESGEKKYLRLHAKDYSLDDQGSLKSVTVQYQLY